MKASEKKIITAFLGKTLNLPTDKVDQLFEKNGEEDELKSDSLDELLKHDATRVKTFKDENAEHFLNGQKKATKEFGETRDKAIKKKYEIDSDKIGEELIDEIIALKTKPSDLDDEKVKIHPVYTKAEKEFQKKLKEQEDAFKAQQETKEKEIARKETMSKIKAKVIKRLKDDLKPVFGTTDETKIQNQIDRLLMLDIEQHDFIEQDGETIVMKDGKRLEDKHGKAITFDSFVDDNAAKHWEFEKGVSRQGSGGTNDPDPNKTGTADKNKWTGAIPKTDEEFSKVFNTITDKAQRVAFTEAYDSQGKAKV